MSWQIENNFLVKSFEFKNFKDAISFMISCSFEIENQNHHPNWTNIYNKIIIKLNTHDANNQITEKDYHLANAIDGIYKRYQA